MPLAGASLMLAALAWGLANGGENERDATETPVA